MTKEHIDTTYNIKGGTSETVCNQDTLTTVREDANTIEIRRYESSGTTLLGDPVPDRNRYKETVIPKHQVTSIDRERRESSGCFISTACVEAQGLPDNCEELTILRQWRDTYLTKLSDGPELLGAYYASAPALVAEISRRADAAEIWRHVYQRLLEAVELIRLDKYAEALQMYRRVAEGLQEHLAGGRRLELNEPRR